MPFAPKQFRPAGLPTPEQAQRQQDARRGSARQRGYGAAWEKLRKWHLRGEPLCRRCKAAGRLEAAALVDHIRPVQSADDPAFYDVGNLQSLCIACHAAKTSEDKAAGLARRPGR